MKRVIEYPQTEYRDSILHFLRDQGYSSQIIIRLKQDPEGVCLNGNPVFVKTPLCPGDRLTITIKEEVSSEKIPPVQLPLDIVYEDEDVLVVNKPANMPIHPSLGNYENSLANALAFYYEQQNTPFVFRCLTRLDRDTSGLTLIAKHMLSAGILSAQLAKKGTSDGIEREYLAICEGIFAQKSGTIDAPIARTPGSIMERMVSPDGDRALTYYIVLQESNTHSLLRLRLETGRTHQIRVHCKYIGHPIIGDFLYHPEYSLIARQALHSEYLAFTHPITKKRMEFHAPLPNDMLLFPGC